VDQYPLQIAIGFFGLMALSWAALCLYLRATHRPHVERTAPVLVVDTVKQPAAQAA
jgi:hypothetical protein